MITGADQMVWLSHPWGPSCPAYGGGEKIKLETAQSMSNGSTSNSLRFHASNHIGTHMDAPRHFVKDGRTVDSYEPRELCFQAPYLVTVELASKERHVSPAHLDALKMPADKKFQTCDILLIRTAAETYREENRYWSDGPGLDLGLADFIRLHAPKCRAVGIDSISITAFTDRERGRAVHREFLGTEKPFFLLEDLKLRHIQPSQLTSVIVAPLRIEGSDGSPVTVIGWISTR